MINVAAFLPRSEVNGPGPRAVIWLQGCPRTPPCPGCGNPAMLDPARVVAPATAAVLARRVLALPGLSGITLTGGEPFHQAAPLAGLCARLRRRGLTVVTFTGHTLAALVARGRADWRALLAQTDLLVDGPYRADLPCRAPLRASANQRLHYLSGRITPADVGRMPAADLEIVIDPDGVTHLTGFPGAAILAPGPPAQGA